MIIAAWAQERLRPIFSRFISLAQRVLPKILLLDPNRGEAACTAILSCARPVSYANSTGKDAECFAGGVCRCGEPLQDNVPQLKSGLT